MKSKTVSITSALIWVISFTCLPNLALAHKGEAKPKLDTSCTEALSEINNNYQGQVKKNFEKSCVNCHSMHVQYPWYYRLPIARTIIDRDISEGQEHLILGDTFPFKSHASPLKDLEAIKKSIDDDSMPPFRYLALNWGAYLGAGKKATIVSWANQSIDLMVSRCSD